jgi:hypothetical protein
VDRIPVFNVKEVDPLAKNLGFVIRLDSKALSRVQPANVLRPGFETLGWGYSGSQF